MAFPNKIAIGSPVPQFPAASWNALIDGLNASRGSSKQSAVGGQAPFAQCPRLVVRVHNTLSADIEFGEILGFSEPAISPSEYTNETGAIPSVKGISPSTPLHSNQFVVALNGIRGTDALAGGAIGPAVLMGLAWVKVNWTDDSHTHVKVEEGETKLQSSTSGIKPIWHEEVPDGEYLPAELWALVLLGGGGGASDSITFQKCRVTEEIPPRKIVDGECVNGTGRVIDVDEDDHDIGEEDRPITNRDAWYYPVNAGVWRVGSRVNHGNCFADEWPSEES